MTDRAKIVAALPDDMRTTYEALPDNGIAHTVGGICAITGYSDEVTRQHLATLAAKGLIECNGAWCYRTQARERRA